MRQQRLILNPRSVVGFEAHPAARLARRAARRSRL